MGKKITNECGHITLNSKGANFSSLQTPYFLKPRRVKKGELPLNRRRLVSVVKGEKNWLPQF